MRQREGSFLNNENNNKPDINPNKLFTGNSNNMRWYTDRTTRIKPYLKEDSKK